MSSAATRRRFAWIVFSCCAIAIVSPCVASVIIPLLDTRPDLVQDLTSGEVAASNCRIWLCPLDPHWWPFTTSDYEVFPKSPPLSRQAKDQLFNALRQVNSGLDYQVQHPTLIHKGAVCCESSAGHRYYLIYSFYVSGKTEYVLIRALPRGATNPNSARIYHSYELQQVLRQIDPWWP
jgi:hypothetical protein